MTHASQNITVRGMHCTGCELAIEDSVSQLPGIRSVKASYENDQVAVSFDADQTSLEAIVAKIKSAGYQSEFSTAFNAVDPLVSGDE